MLGHVNPQQQGSLVLPGTASGPQEPTSQMRLWPHGEGIQFLLHKGIPSNAAQEEKATWSPPIPYVHRETSSRDPDILWSPSLRGERQLSHFRAAV